MAELLHEQQGLKIVKNERNGFIVATLRYDADPAKRSPEWLKAAKQGMSQAKFEQEYEINYSAMLGEKVFPEIKTRRAEIVIPQGPFLDDEWPADAPMYGGFDYGAKNPSSFHVYVVWDQILYCIWELYEPCKNIIEFSAKMKACPYWGQLRWIAADPSIFNLQSHNLQNGLRVSVADQFYQLGVGKLTQGNTDESAWMAQMQKYWLGTEVGFKIHRCCYRMIDEFEQATYVMMSDKQLENRNFKEGIVDKHNHALDDCKYFMNSRPSLKARKVQLPNLVDRFSPWAQTKQRRELPEFIH